MADLDFQDRMMDAIEENCNLFKPMTEPIIKDDEGIGFMLTPIGEETRYMDGTRERTYAFQVSARNSSQTVALNTLLEINRFVDGLNPGDIKSDNGTFEMENVGVTSVPNVVQVDDTGVIYASSFEAELLLKE